MLSKTNKAVDKVIRIQRVVEKNYMNISKFIYLFPTHSSYSLTVTGPWTIVKV